MSLWQHFQNQAATHGLVVGTYADARSAMAHAEARRDAMEQLARTGQVFGHHFTMDSDATPQTYRRDGVEVVETINQARRRAVKDAQWNSQVARFVKQDGLSPMASQALTYFFQQIYQIRHAKLNAWNGEYLPINTNIDRAANDFVWYEEDLQGLARAASTYSPDKITLVAGPSGHANRGKIVPALCGYEVNFMDARREALAARNGKPVFRTEQKKLKACHQVLAEFFNALWLWGDPGLGIKGLHNDSRIQVVSLPNGDWANATGLQIKDDLVFMVDFIAQQSRGDLGDHAKLKLRLARQWDTRARNAPVTSAATGTAASAMSYVQDSFKMRDNQFVALDELAAAQSEAYVGGPQNLSRDRAVMTYFDDGASDPDMSGDPAFTLSQPIELPDAPKQTGTSRVQFLHARGGETMIPDSRRIVIFEGFEAP